MSVRIGETTEKQLFDAVNSAETKAAQVQNKVSYTETQALTESQKTIARNNIGAGTAMVDIVQFTGQSTISVMSQKATTDALAGKANTSGTYSGLTVGYAATAGSATTATSATTAAKLGNGNLISDQTSPALSDGKAYFKCTISGTVSTGTYYFYNCSGTLTVGGTAEVYATNCPNLIITRTASNWSNIWMDGVAHNTDNSAIRFKDGMQICAKNIATSMSSYSYFPVAFSSVSAISVTSNSSQSAVYLRDSSLTQILIAGFNEAIFSASYIAIGRWKQ